MEIDFSVQETGEKDKVESYIEKRSWYVEKYAEDLEPPKKDLKVSVIVPAFAELSNDNFWRMFRGLMYQRGVVQEEYEVIYVVNNSEEVAQLYEDKELVEDKFEGSSGEVRKKRFLENQEHIKIIKIAKEAQKEVSQGYEGDVGSWIKDQIDFNGLKVSDYEVGLMIRFAKSKVSFQCIDASSLGRGFPADKKLNPIGLARDIGSFFAYSRFQKIGCDGMVDFIDGDCFFGPNYIRDIKRSVYDGKDAVVKPLRKVIVEVPRQITEAKNAYTRVLSTIKYLASTHSGWDYFEDNINRYSNDNVPLTIYSRVGGPQLTVRSSILPVVDGYPTKGSNEDWGFSYSVVENVPNEKISTAESSYVFLSDRGRDVSTDGKHRGEHSHFVSNKVERENQLNESADSRSRSLCRRENDFLEELGVLMSTGIFGRTDLFSEYNQIKRQCFEQGAKSRYELIERVGKWMEIVASKNYEETPIDELIDWVYTHGKTKKSDRDFYELNKVFLELAVDVLKLSSDGAEKTSDKAMLAMMYLSELLPEYFKTPLSEAPGSNNLGENNNVTDYSHITEAIYRMRSKIRNIMIEQKVSKK